MKYKDIIYITYAHRCALVLFRVTMISPCRLFSRQPSTYTHTRLTVDRTHRVIPNDDLARYFVQHSRTLRNLDSELMEIMFSCATVC